MPDDIPTGNDTDPVQDVPIKAGPIKAGPNQSASIVSLDTHRPAPILDWSLVWIPPHLTPFIRRDAEASGMSVEDFVNHQFLQYLDAYYEEEQVSADGSQLPLFRPKCHLQEVKT